MHMRWATLVRDEAVVRDRSLCFFVAFVFISLSMVIDLLSSKMAIDIFSHLQLALILSGILSRPHPTDDARSLRGASQEINQSAPEEIFLHRNDGIFELKWPSRITAAVGTLSWRWNGWNFDWWGLASVSKKIGVKMFPNRTDNGRNGHSVAFIIPIVTAITINCNPQTIASIVCLTRFAVISILCHFNTVMIWARSRFPGVISVSRR